MYAPRASAKLTAASGGGQWPSFIEDAGTADIITGGFSMACEGLDRTGGSRQLHRHANRESPPDRPIPGGISFFLFPLLPDAMTGRETLRQRMIIMDAMNFAMGKLLAERRLWNESHTREIRLVDEILRPWVVRQRISEGVHAGEMLEHQSAAALLDGVAQWCREYARWRVGSGLPFIEGHPV